MRACFLQSKTAHSKREKRMSRKGGVLKKLPQKTIIKLTYLFKAEITKRATEVGRSFKDSKTQQTHNTYKPALLLPMISRLLLSVSAVKEIFFRLFWNPNISPLKCRGLLQQRLSHGLSFFLGNSTATSSTTGKLIVFISGRRLDSMPLLHSDW